MVVLEIVEHRGARTVVNELGALVEERRVVLVRLDHEVLAAAEARGHVEIAGHTADQKSRIEAGMLEDPRENARGRGLAVRAGDGERPAAREHVPRQPLRPGRVRNATLQQRFDQRVAAAHDVADDDDVRPQLQLLRLVALDQLDAERGELVGHRRIDVLVRAGDAMAGRARQRRDAAHERAADPENVNVHNCGGLYTHAHVSHAAGRHLR